MLRAGASVLVLDNVPGGELFIGIVRRDGAGAFVWAHVHRQIELRDEDEGVVWCRSTDTESREAKALLVASAL